MKTNYCSPTAEILRLESSLVLCQSDAPVGSAVSFTEDTDYNLF